MKRTIIAMVTVSLILVLYALKERTIGVSNDLNTHASHSMLKSEETSSRVQVPEPHFNSSSNTSSHAKKLEAARAAPVIVLTEENFENEVMACFRGELCQLGEDPIRLYRHYKAAGNRKANDSLISFLRSKLRDPSWAAQYKDALKTMIEDFYPPEEQPFQNAAYYSYLGDLEKSLAFYLDLEKKSVSNPKLRPAPKLNIANVLFEMRRFSEALPYYQGALADYQSGKQQVAQPDPREMIEFIESRINEIKAVKGL
jgi:tetratricopeptide (TPR) repeat protein